MHAKIANQHFGALFSILILTEFPYSKRTVISRIKRIWYRCFSWPKQKPRNTAPSPLAETQRGCGSKISGLHQQEVLYRSPQPLVLQLRLQSKHCTLSSSRQQRNSTPHFGEVVVGQQVLYNQLQCSNLQALGCQALLRIPSYRAALPRSSNHWGDKQNRYI